METQYIDLRASQVALVVTHLAIWEMQETLVRSLGRDNPLDRGAWCHRVTKSWTQLSNGTQYIDLMIKVRLLVQLIQTIFLFEI